MNTSNKHFLAIDEYIATFPEEVQKRLKQLRKLVHETVPNVEETISYGMPAFKLNGKGLVYFSGFKNHIGFYPYPDGVEMFKKLSADFPISGKGTVQFPHDMPIPVELVEKIIKFRMEENLDGYKSKVEKSK
jgi:uncharacterized protein YdhG (YjbR/CyaY superfamily)